MFSRTAHQLGGVIVIAGLVAVLAGCSGGGSPSPSNSDGDARGTVGIVEWDTATPIDNQFVQGAKAAFDEDGWTVISQDPKADSSQANAICTQYVTRQVQAIVVVTHPIDTMTQCMDQAKTAEIPVFYIGSPLVDGMAGSVDNIHPEEINDLFVKDVEANAVDSILTLDYTPGTPCRLRAEYRSEVIDGLNLDVTDHQLTIPGQTVDAQNTTAAWLAGHPEGTGNFAIWACWTDPASGAAAALKQAGREDIPIYTWDFNPEVQQLINEGYVAATLTQDGLAVGSQVVELVNNYLVDGKAVSVPSASTVLTKENVDQYVADNPF